METQLFLDDRPLGAFGERPGNALPWLYDDGGRAVSGRRGDAGDCVTRAIAIATGMDYGAVYRDLSDRMKARGKPRSARNGIPDLVYRQYLEELGFTFTATMRIGSGCTVHLRREELPGGTLIARLSRHICAVIDGVIHDTHDPSRGGTRCVYGYWQRAEVA